MSYKLTQTGQRVQDLLNQIENGGQSQVTDAVLYSEQALNEKEQAQARKNIGAAAENQIPTGAVLYSQQQNLTGDQQAQARTNIGVPNKVSELENDAHYITESQVPIALPQKTGTIQSGVLPTTGWDTLGWKQNTLPAQDYWKSVTYGNGKFVCAVGSHGAYSTDGINWTETTMPTGRNWQGVTYGNGKFVAVAYKSDKGAYSTDGITWAEMTMPISQRWQTVTYGNGKFVALGSGTTGVCSTDGVSWETMTMPFSGSWANITYGNGRFLAMASSEKKDSGESADTDKCAYSLDGIHWEVSVLPLTGTWGYASYGNNTFIAMRDNSTVIAHSPDAITWDYSFVSKNSINTCSIFGGDRFIALTNNINTWSSDRGIYSFDGKSWAKFQLPSDLDWESAAYGNGRFLAFASNEGTPVGALSTNGTSWKPMTLPSLPRASSIHAAYGNERFVVVMNYKDTAFYWDVSSKN